LSNCTIKKSQEKFCQTSLAPPHRTESEGTNSRDGSKREENGEKQLTVIFLEMVISIDIGIKHERVKKVS